jgi:hypothetical protein
MMRGGSGGGVAMVGAVVGFGSGGASMVSVEQDDTDGDEEYNGEYGLLLLSVAGALSLSR